MLLDIFKQLFIGAKKITKSKLKNEDCVISKERKQDLMHWKRLELQQQ